MKNKALKHNFLVDTEGLDYQLIDLGEGRKLERFGKYILDRPEIEAKGKRSNPSLWKKADYYFWEERGKKGEWKSVNDRNPIEHWPIAYQTHHNKLKFKLHFGSFKHVGLFPEQVANWKYIEDKVSRIKNCRFLNLFAYTSAASIVAAKAGASVTNVEALKQLTQYSKENAELNGIDQIQWLTDDARTYVKRAVKRGEKYHGILLDPPAFGHGSKGKRWILENDLPPLLDDIKKLLDPQQHFLIINTYSPKMPSQLLRKLLLERFGKKGDFELLDLGLKSQFNQGLILGNLARISNI